MYLLSCKLLLKLNLPMKSYLAALEILGFEFFEKNNADDTKKKIFDNYLSAINDAFFSRKKAVEEDGRHYKLLLMSAGRYLIIQTIDASPLSFGQLIAATQEILALSLAEGFPLRGSIDTRIINKKITDLDNTTFHSFSVKKGSSISKIFDLAALMQWSGCILTANALEQFEDARTKNSATIDDLIQHHLLFRYFIEQINEHVVVVNWLADAKINLHTGILEMQFSKHGKGIPDEDTANLVLVTHDFVNQVQSPHLN